MGMQAHYKCSNCKMDLAIDPGPPMWEANQQRTETTRAFKKQCHRTGKVYEVQVPVSEEKMNRAIFLSLRVGHETVSATVCEECLKSLRPQVNSMWDCLENLVGHAPEEEGAT